MIFQNILKQERFQRYTKGLLWTLVGSGLAQASTFISMIFVARFLGSQDFGQFGILQTTSSLFSTFAGAGLGLANRKFIAEYRNIDKEKCGKILTTSNCIAFAFTFIISGFIIFFATPLSEQINTPELIQGIRISAFIILFTTFNDIQIGILYGFEAVKGIFILYLVKAVATILILPICAFYFRVIGVFIGMGFVSGVMVIISFSILNNVIKQYSIPIQLGTWIETKQILMFSIPAMFGGSLIPLLVFWISKLFLTKEANGFEQLGLYTAAEQWIMVASFIPAAFNNISLPIFSNSLSEDNDSKNQISKIVSIPVIICLFTGFFLYAISPLISEIYGKSFFNLQRLVFLVVFVSSLRVLGGAIGNVIAAFNKMWYSLIFNTIWGLLLIFFSYFFVNLGARGLLFANIIAYSIHSLIISFFLFLVINQKKNEPTK